MTYRETIRCIVCRLPNKGMIAVGHVLDGQEKVLATFCSKRCAHRAPSGTPRRPGYLGKWESWMGKRIWLKARDEAPDMAPPAPSRSRLSGSATGAHCGASLVRARGVREEAKSRGIA